MQKTASQIATTVLEKWAVRASSSQLTKVALRRAGKDFMRLVEKIKPGFRKAYKSTLSRQEAIPSAALKHVGFDDASKLAPFFGEQGSKFRAPMEAAVDRKSVV
jgi:hypothetical protein